MMEPAATWRAAEADEALRRSYPSPDFDDSGWAEIAVPGHWRSSPAFADADGPLLYRVPFEAPAPGEGRRSWLTFDGLFYQADVWLDGSYVGDTEGYFVPHTFEVTEALRERSEHLLALELACSPPRHLTAKRAITGVFQHWDCLDPDWNPGGIWRPVRLGETGPVRIAALRALCTEAAAGRAVVRFRAALDAAEACTVRLRTTVGDTDHELEQPLAAGENRMVWQVAVDRPALWWPHALGDQPLHEVTVTATVVGGQGGGEPSDRQALRMGLRQVRMRNWVCSVNGERLFLKGSNQGPTRMALADAPADAFERDIVLAKEAGLDLLRVHAHVSRPELYDAADRHGVLLWQDFPLQWGYARGLRKQAARQAREAVDLLGHHPSIVVWCGHNEPVALDVEPGVRKDLGRLVARYVVGQQLPSWNKTILDGSLKRAFEKADGSRPVVAHSGVLPHPGSGGTDSHLYFGWYHGDERDLPGALALWPKLARFVSEFGAQAVPETADFLEPERWPDLDWERLGRTHALQKGVFNRRVPPRHYATFAEWQRATQEYQATVVRHHVEHLRRLKYRPTGGFCQFSFADGWPGVSWSVLDHERVPKPAYEALAAACAPVIVTADRPAATYRPGDTLALDVHVVSDLRTPVSQAQVRATLRWEGGSESWAWGGDVPADSCVRIGMVDTVVPDAPGPLVLELALDATDPDVKAANRYESLVVAHTP
jgi:beta-mannosidase